MANYTLKRPDVFPQGTTVKAFRAFNTPPVADVGTPEREAQWRR